MITSCGYYFQLKLNKKCGFFTNDQFFNVGHFFDSDFITLKHEKLVVMFKEEQD